MDRRLRLVLLSFLMLFVELALIRWTGANVVYLSYFSNFVLLGSFLGIGVGFLRGSASRETFPWAPVVLAALVAFVLIFPVKIDRSGTDLIFFGSFRRSGLPTWITLPLIFGAVAAVMTMIAEGVARTFATLEPLEAYRFDILGSILGIAAFSGLSFLHAPPLAWATVAAASFVVLLWPRVPAAAGVALLALGAMLGVQSTRPNETWSPYYRIALRSTGAGITELTVNGIPHQSIEAISRRARREPIYLLPFERAVANPLDDVLIIGAGNGTDVAFALSKGAEHVDAVEIDPGIQRIGASLHPDRPYDDPRVTVHIDDGRAFLERTKKRYDMILFALPDSLTLVAGQSAIRLESYLFTREAIEAARDHLKPHGVFAMYNYYRERWLVDRLAGTLGAVFGRAPCVDAIGSFGGLAMLTVSANPADLRCPSPWIPTGDVAAPVTDDHPFLYLRTNAIPGFYLLTIALIIAASVIIVRSAGGPLRRMRPYVDLFFMGAAFLLLETKNVVQFALLFGTTWLVNALVFTGILMSVLAAIEVSRRVSFRDPRRLYGLLLIALVIAYAMPLHALLGLAVPVRFLAAASLAFAPIFLANLVFAQRFKDVGSSTVAFGANLLGAMVGGVLEYASLVTGYRTLLIAVALLYGAAFAFGRRALADSRA